MPRQRPPTEPPHQRGADWLAWSLQLLLGLLVGASIGALAAERLLAREALPIFLAGSSLLGGGIHSYLGDRVWFPRSIYDSEPPAQSKASRCASWIIGGVGALLCLVALLEPTPRRLSWRMSFADVERLTFSGYDTFYLLCGLFTGLLVLLALRTDRAYSVSMFIDRYEQPLAFWLYIIFGTLATMGAFARALG